MWLCLAETFCSQLIIFPRPVSWQDFLGAVPVDAYMGQFFQAMPDATTEVVDLLYSPHLAVPPQLRTLDPMWKNCVVHLEGVWDPPLPLMAASSIAQPSMPTFPTTTNNAPAIPDPSPAPGSLPTTPYISATADGQSRTLPTKGAEAATIAKPSDPMSQPSQVPPLAEEVSRQDPPGESDNLATRIVFIINGLNSADSRILTIGGVQATVSHKGSVAVVEGQTVTLGGRPATLLGQEVSLATDGLKFASSTRLSYVPSASTQPNYALIPNGDKTITAIRSDSRILLSEGTSGATLDSSGTVTFGDKTMMALPFNVGVLLEDEGAIFFDPSSQVNVIIDGKPVGVVKLNDDTLLLVSGSYTIAIGIGDRVEFDGTTVEVLADSSGLILTKTHVVPFSKLEEHAGYADDAVFRASDNARYVVIQVFGEKVTLKDGAATILGGSSFSADRDGRYVVLNGSITKTVASSTATRTSGTDVFGKEDDAGSGGNGNMIAASVASSCWFLAFNWVFPMISAAALLVM